MARIAWVLGTFWMAMLRSVIVARLLLGGGLIGVLIGCVELVALVFGTRNWSIGRPDFTWRGAAVPALYTVGLFCVPRGLTVPWYGSMLGFGGFSLSLWALVSLRSRFTYGGSSWVSLCRVGPYRFVRHPQQVSRLLFLAGLIPGAVGPWDVARLLLAGVCAVGVVVAEESFLAGQEAFVSYRTETRFLLVPGVV